MQTAAVTLTSRLEALAQRADVFLPPDLPEQDRAFLRDILIASGVFFGLMLLVYIASINWGPAYPLDGSAVVIGRDFMNFWMYGQAALTPEPGRFYNPVIYNTHLATILDHNHPWLNWSYPPSIMFLAVPFGQIGYFPALLIWTLLGIAVFVPVALAYARGLGIGDWKILLPVVFSPAAAFCLISGQNAFFTASLLIGAFLCLDRRPLLAGFLIGVLTLKPQLGLLFPLMLVVSGRWRVFWAAAATALGIAALTAAVFGPEVWIAYITKGLPVQNVVLSDPPVLGTKFYPTVFGNIRGLYAPYAVAMAGQLVFSVMALAAVGWGFYRHRDAAPQLLLALFLTGSVSFSPYVISYDMLPATFAAIMLLASGTLDPVGRRLAQLLYWTAGLQFIFGMFHIPGPALIPPAVMIYLVLLLRRAPAREPGQQTAAAGAPALG